jgi:hypothetical protein
LSADLVDIQPVIAGKEIPALLKLRRLRTLLVRQRSVFLDKEQIKHLTSSRIRSLEIITKILHAFC